jgi:hypothetical protein
VAIEGVVKNLSIQPDALVVAGTPTHLEDYSRKLFYCELWRTVYGSPMLSLLQEMSIKQVRQYWKSGGYHSNHTTTELFALLNPLENIRKIEPLPLLLVYSNRDCVAPPEMARAMFEAAPQAMLTQDKRASHVMLTLAYSVDRQIARWLGEQLS